MRDLVSVVKKWVQRYCNSLLIILCVFCKRLDNIVA